MRIWAESARSIQPIFPTLRCPTWVEFINGDCNENVPHVNMGVHFTRQMGGVYTLQTNTRDPWSRDTPFPN